MRRFISRFLREILGSRSNDLMFIGGVVSFPYKSGDIVAAATYAALTVELARYSVPLRMTTDSFPRVQGIHSVLVALEIVDEQKAKCAIRVQVTYPGLRCYEDQTVAYTVRDPRSFAEAQTMNTLGVLRTWLKFTSHLEDQPFGELDLIPFRT